MFNTYIDDKDMIPTLLDYGGHYSQYMDGLSLSNIQINQESSYQHNGNDYFLGKDAITTTTTTDRATWQSDYIQEYYYMVDGTRRSFSSFMEDRVIQLDNCRNAKQTTI